MEVKSSHQSNVKYLLQRSMDDAFLKWITTPSVTSMINSLIDEATHPGPRILVSLNKERNLQLLYSSRRPTPLNPPTDPLQGLTYLITIVRSQELLLIKRKNTRYKANLRALTQGKVKSLNLGQG